MADAFTYFPKLYRPLPNLCPCPVLVPSHPAAWLLGLASSSVHGRFRRDITTKGREGRVRTVAIPFWVKQSIDRWTHAAGITDGPLLPPVSKSGKLSKLALGDRSIWSVVERCAKEIGIKNFGAHDLRRTCAKLCRESGGDLEQIKFLLGHSSIQTTERYLGACRRRQ